MKLKVIIFGTGNGANRIYGPHAKKYEVLAFADNSAQKQGTHFLEIPVINPSQITSLAYDKIIIASQFSDSIFIQLIEYGLNPDKIEILPMEQLLGTPQELSFFKRTVAFIFLTTAFPILALHDFFKRRAEVKKA
jgi:hypothetical protein